MSFWISWRGGIFVAYVLSSIHIGQELVLLKEMQKAIWGSGGEW